MKVYELNNLIKNSHLVEERIKRYLVLGSIKMQEKDCSEIAGHLGKSENNLKFVLDNLKLGYFDWCITGCYYAVYHAALALILAKGYSSKNHDATLCILIKEHYNKEISEEDLNLINKFFISYQDYETYKTTQSIVNKIRRNKSCAQKCPPNKIGTHRN